MALFSKRTDEAWATFGKIVLLFATSGHTSHLTKMFFHLWINHKGSFRWVALNAVASFTFSCMRKTHPDRNDPIYCVLCSELCRSERGYTDDFAEIVNQVLQTSTFSTFSARQETDPYSRIKSKVSLATESNTVWDQ